MGSGERDQRVAIQTVTRTANVMNEPEEAWATTFSRWAKIEGRGGREMQRANQTTPTATHLVTLPTDSQTKAITTDQRIVWAAPGGDLTLGIVNVDKSRWREGEIVCLCEAAG